MKYWLMKSEPEELSIQSLAKVKTTWWTGVRNYQARNFMTNEMQVGDRILFYHSNAEPSGVAGTAVVTQLAQPDALQFDKKSEYYDPKASRKNPRWYCVEIGFESEFANFISLQELKNDKNLSEMMVIKKGQRLSIQPLQPAEFEHICQLGGKKEKSLSKKQKQAPSESRVETNT